MFGCLNDKLNKSQSVYLCPVCVSVLFREQKPAWWRVSSGDVFSWHHILILQSVHVWLSIIFCDVEDHFFCSVSRGGTWANAASQAPTKSWPERNGQFQRADPRKNPDHRGFPQVAFTPTGRTPRRLRRVLLLTSSRLMEPSQRCWETGFLGQFEWHAHKLYGKVRMLGCNRVSWFWSSLLRLHLFIAQLQLNLHDPLSRFSSSLKQLHASDLFSLHSRETERKKKYIFIWTCFKMHLPTA